VGYDRYRKKKMKVITICGSLKFEDDIKKYTQKLELEGNCVLSIVYSTKEKNTYTDEELHTLEVCHYKKIELSDAIFVVNKNGYIGESVKKEIKYASDHNKEIIYLENRMENSKNEGNGKTIYNKLVRDKIVNIIESKGNKAMFNVLSDKEFIKELNRKLLEETKEFIENNETEELADIYEVINKIIEIKNIDVKEVERIRIQKKEERGGFENKIFLKEVSLSQN
jgi:predicted house-cleaning noncanonical NTP pyrophosphatase (MazG superfamily)